MRALPSFVVILGLVATGAALTSETQATCSFARLFNSVTNGYSYVYTPGVIADETQTSMTGKAIGSFWMMGAGLPGDVPEGGIDNGRFEALIPYVPGQPGYYYHGWMRNAPGYPLYIQGPSWASSADIDLCPDQIVGQKCMAMLLADEVNGVGYFAFLTDEADAAGNYNFVQAGNAPINLIRIPKLALTGSNRLDPDTIALIVAGPSAAELAGGLYLDPNCSGLGDITGYKIRSQTVPLNSQPPSDRDVSQWADVTPGGGTVPLGQSTMLPIDCSSDSDVYLVTSLEFDSGFEFGLISENSSRVSCSLMIADPEPVDRKTDRPPARKTKR